MTTFQPIPFDILIKRIFREYEQYEKILGLPQEHFYSGFPGENLSIRYMDRRASTPLGPAAGPHTQLAQNIVLTWLTGARAIELKTIQLLNPANISHPAIDTENIGLHIESSQELKLEESLREYVKAWMLIAMITQSEILGEDFSRHDCETIFDLSIGYNFKDIKSERIYNYIENLKDAQPIIDMLREEIPAEFSQFKTVAYDPHIINRVTLSTAHDCTVEEVDHIVSHLFTAHQLNVTIKLNPTLLGQEAISHLLNTTLGYEDIAVSPKAFKPHLTFVQTIKITKSMYAVARNLGRTLGLKFINPLMIENHKGYLDTDLMYLSGPPLHVFALQIVKKFREALGGIHSHIPMAFAAGVDDKNFADVVSANLAPVTVCTDILKPPGSIKFSSYLKDLGEKMQAVEAINIPDYIMKRFGHEVDGVHDVFAKLRKEVGNLGQRLPEEDREETVRAQLQTFNQLELRVLNAMKENSDSLELLTTDALIITDTLKACHQKFGESALMPHTFKELYLDIISAVATRNLETLFDQIMQNNRYTFAHNSAVPEKEDTELGLYDCLSCGDCVTICPNNANFVYHVSPSKITYVNYELTEDGLKEIEGGQFVIEKTYQIANFDDCCNECSVCAIHCPERGQPYTAKPKYFGSRAGWEACKDRDGFFVEKDKTVETIVGRIDGKEYTLRHDTESIQATFTDGVIEGVFEYPEDTLIDKDILDPTQIGHILDLKIYHLLITQLEGVLNDENCNYINIKYV